MTEQYFGNSTVTGNFGESNGGNVFGSLAACPGAGNQYVESLEVYVNGTGRVRMAIYSSDLATLICQGFAFIEILNNSGSWAKHIEFVDDTGTRITPVLQGGSNYYLVHSYADSSAQQLYQQPASGTFRYKVGDSNYTAGFPSSITLPSSWNVSHSIRCKVTDALPIALPVELGITTVGPSYGAFNQAMIAAQVIRNPTDQNLYVTGIKAYAKSYTGYNNGNVRFAVYSEDKSTLIGQGAEQVLISSTTPSWIGNTTFKDPTGNTVGSIQLSAATNYLLVVTIDRDDVAIAYASVRDSAGTQYRDTGVDDYTETNLPTPVTLPSVGNFLYSLKVEVTPTKPPDPSSSGADWWVFFMRYHAES